MYTFADVVRMTLAVCIALAVAGSGPTAAAQDAAPPRADVVRYTIDVTLDPVTHHLSATERIRWRNATESPTDELWFHLYLNAFAGSDTTFMQELGGSHLRSGRRVDSWGWTRVTSMALDDGTDLLPSLELARPDDGNPHDRTVAVVALPEEVPPGGVVVLDLKFEARLPRVSARTGWAGEFHLVGQWFPKLGVLEEDGWNCHQFHAASEFYADFGSYEVTVTVPEGWVVGGGGVEVRDETVAEGTTRSRRVTYRAERVHDFVWTAAPADLMAVVEAEFDPSRDVPPGWLEEAARLLDRSTADIDLPPARLRLLIPTSQAGLADRMLRAARLAMAWYGLRYGPYPYPQLTIVSPPVTAMEAAGMEYPTFITTGASRWMLYPPLKWLPFLELVTVHEFGHQYFQSLVASNEFEEAWLDEGLNSYAEAACMAAIRRDGLVPELPWTVSPWLSNRLQFLGSRRVPVRIDRPSWEFRTRNDYFLASYTKATLVLRTLESLVGPERFARAMRSYAERYRFRHPTGEDFQAALESTLGEDLDWFFDQAVRGEAVPDWAVLRVRRRADRAPAGFEWRDGAWRARTVESEGEPADQGSPTTIVELAREGDFVGPVEVELEWSDGTVDRRSWDGEQEWVRWSYERDAQLEHVAVDPDGTWAMEVERADNVWRRQPDRGAVCRRLWWVGELVRAGAALAVPWS